jgi:fumarylacetoacetate (FAA) hydrolase
VDSRLRHGVAVPHIAPTLQRALDHWDACAPQLQRVYEKLESGQADVPQVFDLDASALAAPLPRAYQWLDGSAYLSHVELVRRARGATLPPELLDDPLMYQGCSDPFLGAADPIYAADEEWAIDVEAEIAVVLDDVPMGIASTDASSHVKLLMLVNDVTLRNLLPAEIAKGFGFVQGKPPTACSPVAVTPDELGPAWDGARVHLPLVTHINDQLFGNPDAGVDMHFGFSALIAHAARTRPLQAGTVIGSGTVSNRDPLRGASCIIERRTRELLDHGTTTTPFLRFGDRVRIEMLAEDGQSIFGAIEQVVERYGTSRPLSPR